MVKQEFNITINAPREQVWEVLWGNNTYPEWTSAFAEGSKVITDWKKGSKVLFLDANNRGMVSQVAENIPNEFMSFRHLGEVQNGVEDISSDKIKDWAGAMENYTLTSVDSNTRLSIQMDLTEEHKDFFARVWPLALQKVKELAEKNH